MTANKTTPQTSSRIARTVFARSSDWRGMALWRFVGTWLAGERSDLVRCMMPPTALLDDPVRVRGPDEPNGNFRQNRATRAVFYSVGSGVAAEAEPALGILGR